VNTDHSTGSGATSGAQPGSAAPATSSGGRVPTRRGTVNSRVALLVNDPDMAERFESAIAGVGFEPISLPDSPDVSALVGCAAVVATSVRLPWNVNERLHTAGATISDANNPREDARLLAWLASIGGRDIPAFVGCLPLQLWWSVYRGGRLSTHVEGHCVGGDPAATVTRTVQLRPGTLLHDLTGDLTVGVKCAHQQAPDWPPPSVPGLKAPYRPTVTGTSGGVIEVVEARRFFGVGFELIENPELFGLALLTFVQRNG
jgi:Peptidase C26